MERTGIAKSFPLAVIGLIAFSATAEARSVPASYGLPWSDRGCFSTRTDGVAENTGCDVARIQFPLIMDAAGWFTATVHAFAPNFGHNVACHMQSMTNGDGSWVTWWPPSPADTSLSMFGAGATISMGYPSYANGAVFINCTVSLGARILVVEW
jgi:hypothetical protein